MIYPLTLLPEPVFVAVWFALGAAAYVWLLRPLRWVWAVPLGSLALEDLRVGNCTWLLALAVAVGATRSPAWCAALFTKVTPALGVLWLVPQRRWRELRSFAIAAAAVLAVSVAVSPQAWADWVRFVAEHRGSAMPVLLVAGVAAAVLAGWRRWPWLVPVAVALVSPVAALYSIGLLCSLPRLWSTGALARARVPFGGPAATTRHLLGRP